MYLPTFLQFCLNCLVNNIDWVVIFRIGFLWHKKLEKTLRFFWWHSRHSLYQNSYSNEKRRLGMVSLLPGHLASKRINGTWIYIHTKYSLKLYRNVADVEDLLLASSVLRSSMHFDFFIDYSTSKSCKKMAQMSWTFLTLIGMSSENKKNAHL